MKIVLTVEQYAPHIGGAERVVQRVAEGLAQRGHGVIVVTSGRRSTEMMAGVRVERFPVCGNDATGIRGSVGEAVNLIRQAQPDVLFNYAAQTWTTDTSLQLLDGPRAFAHVLAPCGFSALRNARYAGYFTKLKQTLTRFDALVFHSDIYQDWRFAVDADVNLSQMWVIPNAADEPATRPTQERVSLLFSTVGSHVHSKGHADFIRAVKQLSVAGVVVAPPRRGRQALRGCQPGCFLESIRPGSKVAFTDGRPPKAVATVLARSDAFLFASRVECAPLVILEAMAARVPWVSYDVGNVAELEGGIVVRGFDELVAAAANLARNPSKRHQLGSAGHRAWEARHRWPPVIDAYEQLFLQLR